jgi:hypothetical protein
MTFGAVAQLGERRPCKAEVAGSIPVSSTKILARRRQRSTFPHGRLERWRHATSGPRARAH